MLINVMNQPEKWKNMVQEMKFLNKQRKAFFEEFSKIIPDWECNVTAPSPKGEGAVTRGYCSLGLVTARLNLYLKKSLI